MLGCEWSSGQASNSGKREVELFCYTTLARNHKHWLGTAHPVLTHVHVQDAQVASNWHSMNGLHSRQSKVSRLSADHSSPAQAWREACPAPSTLLWDVEVALEHDRGLAPLVVMASCMSQDTPEAQVKVLTLQKRGTHHGHIGHVLIATRNILAPRDGTQKAREVWTGNDVRVLGSHLILRAASSCFPGTGTEDHARAIPGPRTDRHTGPCDLHKQAVPESILRYQSRGTT